MLPTHVLKYLSVALAGILLVMGICRGAVAGAVENPGSDIRYRLEAAQAGFPLIAAAEPLLARESLLSFYEDRHYERAWFAGDMLRPEARDLLRTIDRSAGEGLQPTDYHQHAIARLIGRLSPDTSNATRADLDLLLSDAFLLLGSHLLSGKVSPVTLRPEWAASRPGEDMAPLLDQALEAGAVEAMLDTLRPSQPGYQRMREERKRFADLNATSQWQEIPSGPLIRPGESDPRLSSIRERLVALGDHPGSTIPQAPLLPATTRSQTYDIALLAAVSRLQARHGLKADGIIGPETIGILNISPAERLRQIDVNMERWRWLPEQLGAQHVLVNLAGLQLNVVQEGKTTFKSALSVGPSCSEAPVFSDEISYFVFNPSWTVPPSVLASGNLKGAEEPGRLEALGFRVFRDWGAARHEVDPADVDWANIDKGGLPYQLVQAPGIYNPLGKVKIMFPNPFGVYLHDIPAAHPTTGVVPTFNQGCVRVEKALDMADLLLGKDQGWSRGYVRNAAAGESQTLHMTEPMPIHVQYLTAWANESGILQVRRDLYQRDQRLASALASQPGQP